MVENAERVQDIIIDYFYMTLEALVVGNVVVPLTRVTASFIGRDVWDDDVASTAVVHSSRLT